MKIAFIGQKGIPTLYGGVERHVENVATRLAENGEEVFVYTRPYYTLQTKSLYRGVRLISLPSLKTKHWDAISHTFFATLHAIAKRYDVIHYQGVGPALLSFLPRIFRPTTKVITTIHTLDRQNDKWNFFVKTILWAGEWAACAFSHKVIAVSQTLASYIYEAYGINAEYIPNGISENPFETANLITSQFNLKKDEYILSVARLVPHKGLHYLIEAFQEIKTRKKLVIVGDSSFTDEYAEKLKALAKNDSRIIFTGFQTGKMLSELFSGAYCFVQPSEFEGLAISVLEAASYGKCILASDIPANTEVIRTCGVTFQSKNTADLQKKLNAIIKNPRLVREIGKKSRQHVLEHYHWKNIVKELQMVYRNIVSYDTMGRCQTPSPIKA